ncbi:MAG: diaminopimelate epimerase [Dehalococcoidia bacterium]|nr:MAG: diaminopimelate epimerase [Dehalococcoidia bacterium]
MNFTKLQGAGNDFILVEAGGVGQDWSPLAMAMCDRHFGIGADGLLLLLPSDTADFRMRVFNPDGSETEACGNGLRCLVRYVVDKGLLPKKLEGAGEILVDTMAGIRRAKIHKAKGKLTKIQVGMGTPKFEAEDIPVVVGQDVVDIKSMLSYHICVKGKELLLNLVSMGNPHAVYFWQHSVSDFPLSELGPEVERHRMFPNRTNFEVANVISRQQIEARVWERGVGETLACGSGACAVAVAAQRHGYIDNKVDIKLPGGILGVEWDGVGEVFLSGPAEIVFTGEWPDEDRLSRVD